MYSFVTNYVVIHGFVELVLCFGFFQCTDATHSWYDMSLTYVLPLRQLILKNYEIFFSLVSFTERQSMHGS
jgi:hypothetical protein